MNLNDPRKIRVAKNTHLCEVEVLYWVMEDALYEGKTSLAKSMLDMFLYLGKYRKDLIAEGLKQPYRDRLKQLCHELHSDNGYKKTCSVEMKHPLKPKKLPIKKEKDLQKYLVDHTDMLSDALGDEITMTDTEVVTDFEYACDIVAKSKNKFYPIELKIAQADHKAVSQILKYCYYFYRSLRYDRFKDIQGVVIANGMDAWSINELRRENIWVYDIIRNGDSNIALQRIN